MDNESFDFSGVAETLQNMLSGEEGQRQLQNIMSMLSGGSSDSTASNEASGGLEPESIEMMFKLQKAMSKLDSKKNSSQSQLLSALKPFLKPSRRKKVDSAMRLIKLSAVIEAMNETQGD